jgi:hypothetical protein
MHGAHRVEIEEAASAVSEVISFGEVAVDAPGFDQNRFKRTVARALADDLAVTTDATGQAIVGPRVVNGGYAVSRHSCSCKAGQLGTPCKHRAALFVALYIREPAIARQWAEARKVAA